MKIDISKEEINALYARAKVLYHRCINGNDNESLQVEIGIPLNSIRVVGTEAKIAFAFDDPDRYTLEACLYLFNSESDLLGKYMYVEDDKGNAVSDDLIFY
ncbi:hypothetical protein [Chitinophaga caseinilytica]|uniref:Uncharacterized protein n=1 Tax=Chitinophaga caseinilytica TaxID=2267521 RepID=A0ABZ2YYH3_9BACT